MVKSNKAPHSQQSVKCRAKLLKGPVKISDFADVNNEHISIDNNHAKESFTSRSTEIMSTSELISTVGKVWDRASRSLSRYQPKASWDSLGNITPKDDDVTRYVFGNNNLGITNLIERGYLHVDFNSSSYFSCTVQQSLTLFKATRHMRYVPCNDKFIEKLCLLSGDGSSIKHDNWLEEHNFVNMGTLYSLTNRYRWMNQISNWPKLPIRTQYTYNLVHGLQYGHCTASKSMDLSSGSLPDGHVGNLTPYCAYEPNQMDVDVDHLVENEMRQCENLTTQDEVSESCSSDTNKPHPLLANPEHAVSGALAGAYVCVCLHPIDTIKTIVQSCQHGQRSFWYIGQSVLSERGISGLYRGISSNITTSAPISAIYTFTYESVKEFLLPSLAKEYHSVAHCTAGACASIATSFVFTPSEHIKQQMQVNSKYQNCWNAVKTIIEVGGLRSLYAGWGAVLCRNIPHSVIKFYTYESLKKMFISSYLPNKQPNTSQTLLCGGLAGSTAALFSTPFDVVKTRLQTQMPGSTKYHSILNALQDICKHEGFRGLYRGLIPRLAMYVSQGALFFTSYEFFKNFLSLELHQQKAEMLQHKQKCTDDPILS